MVRAAVQHLNLGHRVNLFAVGDCTNALQPAVLITDVIVPRGVDNC